MLNHKKLNSVIETRDYFKNGASLKSQMSRNNFFVKSFIVLIVISSIGTFRTFAQNQENEIFYTAEKMPIFPGGDQALFTWLANNVKYPGEEIGIGKKVDGRVTLRLVVKNDGSIGDVQVEKSLEPNCDAAAIQAVKKMPKWAPGENEGKPVNCYYRIPIRFSTPREFLFTPEELRKAEQEEKDDITKYIKIENQDIFFAKGDGLNFGEWVASGSQDLKNWNVFVIAKVKNVGNLPKRIKATVTLNVTSELTVRVLLMSESRTWGYKFPGDWYMNVDPGTENTLAVFFKFQESGRAEGNILFGDNSHTYIDKDNAFNISFDYYDADFPASILEKQSNLIEALRKNGNVEIKEGYASRYYEERVQRMREASPSISSNGSSSSNDKSESSTSSSAGLPDRSNFPKVTVRSWKEDGIVQKLDKASIEFSNDGRGEIYGEIKRVYNSDGVTISFYCFTYFGQSQGFYRTEKDVIDAYYVYERYDHDTYKKWQEKYGK